MTLLAFWSPDTDEEVMNGTVQMPFAMTRQSKV